MPVQGARRAHRASARTCTRPLNLSCVGELLRGRRCLSRAGPVVRATGPGPRFLAPGPSEHDPGRKTVLGRSSLGASRPRAQKRTAAGSMFERVLFFPRLLALPRTSATRSRAPGRPEKRPSSSSNIRRSPFFVFCFDVRKFDVRKLFSSKCNTGEVRGSICEAASSMFRMFA